MAAEVSTAVRTRASAFGRQLQEHRLARRLSQLRLGLAADVSARHISFLETGRASPSRDMVRRLSETLALCEPDQDSLLVAAGLAPEGRAADGRDALARAVDIQQALTLDQVLMLTRNGLAGLGLRHFFTGVVTPAADGGTPAVAFGDMRYAPSNWIRHYQERGFRASDPFVRVAASGGRPFFWSDVLKPFRPAPLRDRQMLAEAQDFGITGGFVMPIRRPDGTVHALSSMGADVANADPRVRWEARVLATAALERIEELQAANA